MALNTLTWQRCLATLAPSGTIEITENGEYDVAQYATADVSVSGGATWGSPVSVSITTEDGEITAFITQTPMEDEQPDTYISCTILTSYEANVPSGLYCALMAEDTLSFTIDNEPFTDYEVNQYGMYCFQMPVGEAFAIIIGA